MNEQDKAYVQMAKTYGTIRRMGRLTDSQIADFYFMQARDGFAKQAIEELCRTEGKSAEEITAIIDKYRRKTTLNKFSQQTKEAVILDRMNGIPAKTVAEQQGLTVQQVYDICNDYKKKVKREVKAAAPDPVVPAEYPKVPKKVPDDAVPVKFRKSSDEVPDNTEGDVAAKTINVFAVMLAMQQFVGAIAEGAEITKAAVSAGNSARVSFSFGGINYGLELRRIDS